MSRPIRFEKQYLPKLGCTVVALDARLSDFEGKPFIQDGRQMIRLPEKTAKDCRNIDGTIYLHLGRATDSEMTRLIELYQKALKNETWHENDKLIVPDEKLDLGL